MYLCKIFLKNVTFPRHSKNHNPNIDDSMYQDYSKIMCMVDIIFVQIIKKENDINHQSLHYKYINSKLTFQEYCISRDIVSSFQSWDCSFSEFLKSFRISGVSSYPENLENYENSRSCL